MIIQKLPLINMLTTNQVFIKFCLLEKLFFIIIIPRKYPLLAHNKVVCLIKIIYQRNNLY